MRSAADGFLIRDVVQGEIVYNPDDFILDERQALGTQKSTTIIGQFVFGNFPGIPNRSFQLAQNSVADLGIRTFTIGCLSQRRQACSQCIGVDQSGVVVLGGCHTDLKLPKKVIAELRRARGL
jgi:hypothetical protein